MIGLFDAGQSPVYVISKGDAIDEDFERSADAVLALLAAAIDEKAGLFQIREKKLSGKNLFTLALSCAKLAKGTSTRLLINDRADIAAAAGADGVHLTSASIPPSVIRETFGTKLLIGRSVHSSMEAEAAASEGGNFAMYGPVFPTPGKGRPIGLKLLAEVCESVRPFPIIGIGGIEASNCREVMNAGAAGVAGIRSFSDRDGIRGVGTALR